jgi:mannose-6-phosphate isomerase-like protein (cupin superfamily)
METPLQVTVDEAMERLPAPDGSRFVEVLAQGSVTVELYAPLGTDAQVPHDRDELYVVVSGTGRFVRGDREVPFGPGDVLFVPAGAPHHFAAFTPDFATWVVFVGPEGPAKGTAAP